MTIATLRKRRYQISGFGLVEIMIVVCIIVIVVCMTLPAIARARAQTNETLCIHNLRRIEQAKALWFTETKQDPASAIKIEALAPYFQNGLLPVCPQDGEYTIGSMEEVCTCSLDLAGHQLEPAKAKHPNLPNKPKNPGLPPSPILPKNSKK